MCSSPQVDFVRVHRTVSWRAVVHPQETTPQQKLAPEELGTGCYCTGDIYATKMFAVFTCLEGRIQSIQWLL